MLSNRYGTGPWWWSSGQRAPLLLWQSEFESGWSLQFFCKNSFEKNKNGQKEAGVGPLKTDMERSHACASYKKNIYASIRISLPLGPILVSICVYQRAPFNRRLFSNKKERESINVWAFSNENYIPLWSCPQKTFKQTFFTLLSSPNSLFLEDAYKKRSLSTSAVLKHASWQNGRKSHSVTQNPSYKRRREWGPELS